jgi:hypothetical protein
MGLKTWKRARGERTEIPKASKWSEGTFREETASVQREIMYWYLRSGTYPVHKKRAQYDGRRDESAWISKI